MNRLKDCKDGDKRMSHRLYNGIFLPETWPPRDVDEDTKEPLIVPYLQDPPDVIHMNVGRQLFVDDFLIEETSLTRTFGKPRIHEASPVLIPQLDQEKDAGTTRISANPAFLLRPSLHP